MKKIFIYLVIFLLFFKASFSNTIALVAAGVLTAASFHYLVTINSIDKFCWDYAPLKDLQIVSLYDTGCYKKETSEMNIYLLKAREKYLDFLNEYKNDASLYDIYGNAVNATINYLNADKLLKLANDVIKYFDQFSFKLSYLLMEYNRMIDQDHRILDAIGADKEDFPGNLRPLFVEYDKFEKYLMQRNTQKNYSYYGVLNQYQRDFLVSLTFSEESKMPIDRIISYNYFVKSVPYFCKNHQFIVAKVRDYEKNISNKLIELQKEYKEYNNRFLKLQKWCDLFSSNFENYSVSLVKYGDERSIKEICDEIKSLLNSINFVMFSKNDDDYIYLNYLKLNDIEKKLNTIKTLEDQVQEDAKQQQESCFDELKKLIDNEKDTDLRNQLLDVLNSKNYLDCVNAVLRYKAIKGNVSCNIYDLERIINGLDSVGYDVSSEIRILNKLKTETFNKEIYCKDLENSLYQKYLTFKRSLKKLREKYNYLNNMYFKIFGYKEEISPKDEFEEYLILKDKIVSLENSLKKEINEYLKNRVTINYKFDEVPECNKETKFEVIVNVKNDLGFDLDDVDFYVSDMFGKYHINKKIKPGNNEFPFYKQSKVCSCEYKLAYRIGDNNNTYNTYVVDVSSLSNKCKLSFGDELVLESKKPFVELYNGKSTITTVTKSKINYILNNNSGYILVPFKYDIFYLFTNISKKINYSSTNYTYVRGKIVFIFKDLYNKKEFRWTYFKNSSNNSVVPVVPPDPDIPPVIVIYNNTNNTYNKVLDKYRRYLITLLDDKMKKFKYNPDVLEKLLHLKNTLQNDNLTLQDLIYYNKKIMNFSFVPKNFDSYLNFVCSVEDCDDLSVLYEKYKNGQISEDSFKEFLYSSIKKVKEDLLKKYENLHLSYNLRKLKTCFGDDDPIYKKYYNEFLDLKTKFQNALRLNDSKVIIYYNKLDNLNSKIVSLIESQKEKAKYMIDRLKLLLKSVDDPEKYKEDINDIVNMYKNGKYSEVIAKIKSLIKDLNIKPSDQNSSDISALSVIIVFIVIVVGLVFVFNNNKNEKKKIVIKRPEN